MKIPYLPIFATAFALLCGSARGEIRHFTLSGAKVSIEVPAQWQALPDYLGVPLMMMGPELGGGRPVISLTPTGKSYPTLKPNELDRNQGDYRDGREAWLSRRGGRSLAYLPFRSEKIGTSEFNSIGYRYVLGPDLKNEYVEASVYVVCRGKLYHLSTLMRAAHENQYSTQIDRVVRSFACE